VPRTIERHIAIWNSTAVVVETIQVMFDPTITRRSQFEDEALSVEATTGRCAVEVCIAVDTHGSVKTTRRTVEQVETPTAALES
jgi:hypothetical protein